MGKNGGDRDRRGRAADCGRAPGQDADASRQSKRARKRPSKPDRYEHAKDDDAAVVPAETADLVDGNSSPEQRNAEAQNLTCGEIDPRLCGTLGGHAVERHAEEQCIKQRRPSAVIRNERRGDGDDGA